MTTPKKRYPDREFTESPSGSSGQTHVGEVPIIFVLINIFQSFFTYAYTGVQIVFNIKYKKKLF